MKTVFGSQRSGKSVKALSELITFKLKNPKEKVVVLSKDGPLIWNDKFTWLTFESLNNHYSDDLLMSGSHRDLTINSPRGCGITANPNYHPGKQSFEVGFSKVMEPEIRFNPTELPEFVSILGPKCPRCGTRTQEMVLYGVMGGNSLSKNHCSKCGHNWGPGE